MTKHLERPPSGSDDPGQGRRIVATVLASLANGLFRLQLTDGREVVAHAAKDLRKGFTRLLAGDLVLIEVSPFDGNHGRICSRLKSSHQPASSNQPLRPSQPQHSSSEQPKPQQRELS